MNSTLTDQSGSQVWVTRPVSTADMFPDEVFQKRIANKEDGSKYLYESWEQPVRIIFTNNKELRLQLINFNLKDNQFETESLGDTLFIFNNETIKKVETFNSSFVKLFNPKTGEDGFFQPLLVSDKLNFYKLPELHISKGVLNPLTQERSPDVLTKSVSYFYSKGNFNLQQVKLKKKHILNILSNKKKEIITYVETHKFDYSSEVDVVKILAFYNSL
ncbi:MAG TPA: hypothetical protein VKY41_03020 [Xanthomarina sp.]|nr:hypothetical protein [Xanthomarina sp.]